MVNPNSKLLTGVSKLLEQLGSQHKDYSTVLTLQVRLAQVIHDEEQYGPTETTRSELFRVVEQLNRLCRENQQTTFNELSGIVPPYSPAATISTTEQPFLEGAVLYANMMGFSVLPRTVQNEIVGLMKQEIDKFLDLSGAIYWLDFRGGDFLLFLGCKPGEWQADTLSRAFLLGLELQSQVQVLNPQFRLGVTLHWEDGAQRYYLGSGSYLIGQALNEAQLLMSFSDSGHFFMSTVAYHHLDRQLRGREQTFDILFEAIMDRLNDRWPEHKQFFLPDKTCGYTCEIFTFHDRHKRQHTLYSLYGQDQNGHIIGDESTPCHRVAIEYRDTRKPHPDQVFVQRLVEANKATIIGLTHEGTAMFLREALRLREQQKRGFWDELQIVFPSASVLGRVVEKDRIPNFRLKKWEVGKSALFRFLLSRGPDCLERWDCLEFDDNLPFVGNWFVVGQDSGERKSSVRVAPVLPGGDMRDSYTMEVFEGVKAYLSYRMHSV